ncbi:MAG: YadA C-terminal domain-containing protein, partial [Leclercia adecarboxylata]|nr:YadA C-terminal domain-containing protein [Leclercia adecarboxylata]
AEQTNSTAINTETTRAKKAEQANTTAISTMTTSVNANTAGVAANRRDIDTTSTQVNKNTRTLANHEQRITSLEQQNNKQFGALKNQIDENHKEAMAGASSALAASQIPQVSANRDFSVGAGAGTYGGESAVAVGFSARINDRVVTKFAVTGDTQQKFGAGAGVSWEFGN